MIIAVDFDGTITKKNAFPQVGEFRDHAIKALKNIQVAGHRLILWTCRSGKHLEEAKQAMAKEGLVFDAYNDELMRVGTRKVVADIYIDDHNIFMEDVNWYQIEEYVLYLYKKEPLQMYANIQTEFVPLDTVPVEAEKCKFAHIVCQEPTRTAIPCYLARSCTTCEYNEVNQR